MKENIADLYFKPRSWEKPIYGFFQTQHVEKFLRLAGKVILGTASVAANGRLPTKEELKPDFPQNYFIWDSSTEGLLKYERCTRINEAFHVFCLFYTGAHAVAKASEGDYAGAVVDGVISLANVPLFVTHRGIRSRIYRAIEIKKKREAGLSAPYQ